MLSLLATDPPSTVTRIVAAILCLAAGSLLVWKRRAIAKGRWSVPVHPRQRVTVKFDSAPGRLPSSGQASSCSACSCSLLDEHTCRYASGLGGAVSRHGGVAVVRWRCSTSY